LQPQALIDKLLDWSGSATQTVENNFQEAAKLFIENLHSDEK
jgi:hypothetical protein